MIKAIEMKAARHIPLEKRKALTAILVFLEAAEPLREQFVFSGLEHGFNKFESDVRVFTGIQYDNSERQRPDTGNGLSLSDFLASIVRRLRATAESLNDTLVGSLHLDQYERLYQAIRERASQVDCSMCMNRRREGRLCKGIDRIDDEIVSTGGLCIEPFKAMFNAALGTARLYYTTFGTSLPATGLPDVVFHTGFDVGKPHGFPNSDYPVYVGGITNVRDEAGSFWSDVKLTLGIMRFDWTSYLVTPYVLFHECFSHAFSGAYPSPEGRSNPETDDAFAEGWMDWVAFEVFLDLLRPAPQHRVPAATVQFRNQFVFRDEHMNAATLLHADTVNWRKHRGDSIHRARGQRAAVKTLRLLEHFCSLESTPDYDPWEAFLKLSFDLNLFFRDRALATKFVAQCDTRIPAPDREGEWMTNPRYREPLPGIFVRYINTLDVRMLVKEVSDCPLS